MSSGFFKFRRANLLGSLFRMDEAGKLAPIAAVMLFCSAAFEVLIVTLIHHL